MRELTARQLEVLKKLDGEEWRFLEKADAIVAGRLTSSLRIGYHPFVQGQRALTDDEGHFRTQYRLTKDGVARLNWESRR